MASSNDMETGETMGFRASPQQRRLAALARADERWPLRVEAWFQVEGEIEPSALEAALRRAVERHEALRTTLRSVPGADGVVQVVAPRGDFALLVVDRPPGAEEPSPEAWLSAAGEGPDLRAVLGLSRDGRHRLGLGAPAFRSDLPSLANLARELLADCAGQAPEEPAQYPDLAEAFNKLLESDDSQPGRDHWRRVDRRQRLGAALPGRLGGTGEGGPLGAVSARPRMAARCASLAARAGVGLGDFLLAAWAVLLSRLSGAPELTVGLLGDGRSHEALAPAVGPLARCLPLALDVHPGCALPDLLARVGQAAAEARQFQSYFAWSGGEIVPFGFEPRRDLEESPLKLLRDSGAVDGFELRLACRRAGDELELELAFDTRRYPRRLALGLLARLERLLEDWLATPEAAVDGLPALLPAERHQLLVEWNDTARPYPRDLCFHQLFAAQAARSPEAVAVRCEGRSLTYRELDGASDRLAHRLRANGTGPGEIVGVLLDRSLETVLALLGVLKAGAAYLPLDPASPNDRLGHFVADAAARMVLTTSVLADRVPAGSRALPLDAGWDEIDSDDGGPQRAEAGPSDLAYVIYTSGSTGRPKGVAVEHRQLVDYVLGVIERLEIGAGWSFALVSTFAADLGYTALFPALATGGCLHVVPSARILDPDALGELFDREGIDCLKIVPSHLRALLSGRAPARVLPRRLLVLGGEASSWDLVAEVRRLRPACRVANHYGPTETTVGVTVRPVGEGEPGDGQLPLGRPLPNAAVYVLDGRGRPVPRGVEGELYLGGASLARGYLGQPGWTADRFVPDPFRGVPGGRMYRTGDRVRYDERGELEFLGRLDHQVKIRGVRIEPGEIESLLQALPGVRQAVVMAREDSPGDRRLTAYVTGEGLDAGELRVRLREALPEPMVPSAFVILPALPLTPNGKVDRKVLPPPAPGGPAGPPREAVHGELAEQIAGLWRDVLGVSEIRAHDNFFDLGGHSLLLIRVRHGLRERLGRDVEIVDLFRYPTVHALAGFLASGGTKPDAAAAEIRTQPARPDPGRVPIAIVGMAGRFPGAADLREFWRNLHDGVESILFLSDEELLAAGVEPALLRRPDYVPARGVLRDFDRFDAPFFGLSPREAELTDPQQRVFLECAWEALENAGYDSERYPGRIGVFAGVSANTYSFHLFSNPEIAAAMPQIRLGNEKDFLPMRVSYKLGLRGPSIAVQTACSTSLVAVHLACRSLRDGEADMALAGGVSVRLPQAGYFFQEGGILSPDGHCRAFDAEARGTLPGDGVGAVVLKRLDRALEDGDTIHAVLQGSAVNNDGAHKIGFTAPGVDGQVAVIRAALADAGVDPATISYVEAHGTGTALGDPIEVAALIEARGGSGRPCALGSVKTNIGHLDATAGVAGLIKTVLALRHGVIPPSLHFRTPNPEIPFAAGFLYVNTEAAPWPAAEGSPRRAGVSSFGMGGTNAHAILEEAPVPPPPAPSRPWQLLALSARTPEALDQMTANLAAFLERDEEVPALPDLAYTLQVGRRAFEHRRIAVCRDCGDAARVLAELEPGRTATGAARRPPGVVFLFPGQGSQHAGMARELYAGETSFRRSVDLCADLLEPRLGLDLRQIVFAGPETSDLAQTGLAQPALFVVEYALARLWMEWGVRPAALAGHSLGEYVAACLAGVFSLEDALGLIAERSRLMQALAPGRMLRVPLPAAEIAPRLGDRLSLAAVNGPALCVVAGDLEAVAELEARLASEGVHTAVLATSHAFHSPLVEPALEPFREAVRRVRLEPPAIPFLSNVTGTWIRPEEATDPDYWVRHLRQTVRFDDNLRELLREPGRILLEVGPGRTLSTLAERHPGKEAEQLVLASLPPPRDGGGEQGSLFALGRLWVAGVEVDWPAFSAHEVRRRVPAPTYPFERRRYWVAGSSASALPRARERRELREWLYLPSWRRGLPPEPALESAGPWLLFCDACSLGDRMLARLLEAGEDAVAVRPGAGFRRVGEGYEMDPGRAGDYRDLLAGLRAAGKTPRTIVHLWTVTAPQEPSRGTCAALERLGFYSLMGLAQALGETLPGEPVRLGVVSSGMQPVTGQEEIDPAKAMVLGPCRGIPLELPDVVCRSVDVLVGDRGWPDGTAGRLIDELGGGAGEPVVAYRGASRWVEAFDEVRGDRRSRGLAALKPGSAWLLTGGLGGMALELAAFLHRTVDARLVLVARTPLPERSDWEAWIEEHGEEDRVSRRIRRLRELEAAGADVLVLTADVADAAALGEAVALARRRFGRIDGVIHAAGDPPSGILQWKTREAAARVLAPKVEGTWVLQEVLGGEPDVVVLCSSLSSVAGQAGRADYIAANAFLDAFAHWRSAAGGPAVVAVDWDTWRDAGMARDEAVRLGYDPSQIPVGLSAQQGTEVFLQALGTGAPQVVVSVEEIGAAVERGRRRVAPEPQDAAGRRSSPARAAHARPRLATSYVAPRDETERTIAEIWEAVLGIEGIGVLDSFFELGGDSILSLQIIARLHRAGLPVTPKQVFQLQTIAELAAVVGTAAAAQAEQGPVVGEAPLTPIQHWYFEQRQPDPHHFNQAFLASVCQRLSPSRLRRAVARLVEHHDALRLRFHCDEEGHWSQAGAPPSGEAPAACLDLSGLPPSLRGRALEAAAASLQASLGLEAGPLLRVALFDLGAEEPARLLLVVHHLAVDAVSWRILLEDLERVYRGLEAGEDVRLPAKTTSFRSWALRLRDYAATADLAAELDLWSDPRAEWAPSLPLDLLEGENRMVSARTVSVALDAEETRILLQEIPDVFRARLDEALLAAVALAFAPWTGSDLLLVDLEGHGREPVFDDVDLSRTVGWFTTRYPVLLRVAEGGDPAGTLKDVKERLRAIPASGLGWGVLRYLVPEGAARGLRERPRAQVSVLYLGQLDNALQDSLFAPAPEPSGPTHSPRARRPYALELVASVVGGQLRTTWIYSEDLHRRTRIERLAESCLEALRQLAAACGAAGTVQYTASDFPQAGLSQEELDDILSEIP